MRQQLEVMEGLHRWPCRFSCFDGLHQSCILKPLPPKLPVLLAKFSEVVTADKATNTDLVHVFASLFSSPIVTQLPTKNGALHVALTAVFRRPDIIVQGDHALSRDANFDPSLEEDM